MNSNELAARCCGDGFNLDCADIAGEQGGLPVYFTLKTIPSKSKSMVRLAIQDLGSREYIGTLAVENRPQGCSFHTAWWEECCDEETGYCSWSQPNVGEYREGFTWGDIQEFAIEIYCRALNIWDEEE